jgi:uncharacterized membrane protein
MSCWLGHICFFLFFFCFLRVAHIRRQLQLERALKSDRIADVILAIAIVVFSTIDAGFIPNDL